MEKNGWEIFGIILLFIAIVNVISPLIKSIEINQGQTTAVIVLAIVG